MALELSEGSWQSGGAIDRALQLNRDFARGPAGREGLRAMQAALQETRHAFRSNTRDAELLDVIVSLADAHSQAGWSSAVSSYLGDAKDDALLKRVSKVLHLVEARF